MSMLCVLRQIEEADIVPLLANPEQILELLEEDEGDDEDES